MALRVACMDLPDHVGVEVGPTAWFDIDASALVEFREVVGDDSYFALALVNYFLDQLFEVEGSAGINMGIGGATFGEPLAAGDRVRAMATVSTAKPAAGGVRVVVIVRIEADGTSVPACVVETISLYRP